MRLRERVVGLVCSSMLLPAFAFAAPTATARATTASFINWASYLYLPAHSSDNAADTSITTGNAAALVHDWTWTPAAPTQTAQPSGLLASPTVVNGVVYIGANTGVFYALSESTGHVVWKRFLGYITNATCGSLGIVSTATVTHAPGSGPLTVYVAGGDGYLYALDAATGAVDWKSVIALPTSTADYFDWSSPTIVNSNIYIGVSSNCDSPLVVGGEREYGQATGAREHFYQTYPGHSAQPSIWSSAAVDASGQHVFVTTGNGPGGDAVSVVRLDAATLARQDAWKVPASQHGSDSDFGGSPTLFTATLNGTSTPMVGACNKNGTYYALRQGNLAAGPVWSDHVAAPYKGGPQCDAAAIWDGAYLYVAGGNQTTINGVTYAGSIRKLNPATGASVWQRGLAGPPIGSPTMDGAGVIAVTEYGNGSAAKNYVLTLVSVATGAVLRTITIGPDFGQPVFADNKILIPSQNHGLIVYGPPA